MRPIKIPTAGKGFWGAIWLWFMRSRHWEIAKDFHFKIDEVEYVIPKGFQFDGASIPKFLHTWLSPVGVLLMGGLLAPRCSPKIRSQKPCLLLKVGSQ
mgnify:FL=1